MLQKVINNLAYIVIAILIIVIIFLRSCQPGPKVIEKPIITVKIDTVYKELKKDTVYIPGQTKYLPGKIITVNGKVDTLSILKDYFAKRFYQDTIKIDTFGYVLLRDTISQNRIISRRTQLSIEIPTITKTITEKDPYIPKGQLYGGFNIGGNKTNPLNYFGPSLLYKSPKDKIYSLGAGLTPGGIGFQGGMYFKIKLLRGRK